MKKIKFVLLFAVLLSIVFASTPIVTPQVGVYTFHGAADDQKILKVTTVNNASLEDLWGVNWTDVIHNFGVGAENLGAKKKSLVTAVDFSAKDPFAFDATNYTTDNWKWTTGEFPNTPDDLSNLNVTSLYDPTNLTWLVNLIFTQNVTLHNAAAYLAQLPTPVAQYLGALVWEPRWGNVGNTAVHNGQIGDFVYSFPAMTFYAYLENCTETWTWDETFGAFIGYKLQDDAGNTIYEFEIELPGIPGYEISMLLGITAVSIIGMIYIVIRKKRVL